MIEHPPTPPSVAGASGRRGVGAALVQAMVTELARVGAAADDAERVELLRALEAVKAAAAAAQARVTVAFVASQRAAQVAAGVPAATVGRGVVEQVALARRESPSRGSLHVGLAHALIGEMPHTMAALASGELSEYRAILVAQATAVLSVEHRAVVDRRLAPVLGRLSDRQLRAAAFAVAYELDPQSVVARAEAAARGRRVSVRPAPGAMAYLSALLPVKEAVVVYAALHHAADTARTQPGEHRGRGQVMADTLVQRVTGLPDPAHVPVEIQVVVTDRALFDPTVVHDATTHAHRTGGQPDAARASDSAVVNGPPATVVDGPPSGVVDLDAARQARLTRARMAPAYLPGYGPIPAPLLRSWLTDPSATHARMWLRRVYTDPVSHTLTHLDARRREFPPQLRRHLIARDQWCRMPYCGAPIRHLDHAISHADGGLTDLRNGQGLCERHNYAKQAPGWQATGTDTSTTTGGRIHTVTTTTPTGTTYHSDCPPTLPHWTGITRATGTTQATGATYATRAGPAPP
jgi:hypothetical protein